MRLLYCLDLKVFPLTFPSATSESKRAFQSSRSSLANPRPRPTIVHFRGIIVPIAMSFNFVVVQFKYFAASFKLINSETIVLHLPSHVVSFEQCAQPLQSRRLANLERQQIAQLPCSRSRRERRNPAPGYRAPLPVLVSRAHEKLFANYRFHSRTSSSHSLLSFLTMLSPCSSNVELLHHGQKPNTKCNNLLNLVSCRQTSR